MSRVNGCPLYLGSVPERAEYQATVDHAYLAQLAPNSDEQQAQIASVANSDAYNWGYDPVHYGRGGGGAQAALVRRLTLGLKGRRLVSTALKKKKTKKTPISM